MMNWIKYFGVLSISTFTQMVWQWWKGMFTGLSLGYRASSQPPYIYPSSHDSSDFFLKIKYKVYEIGSYLLPSALLLCWTYKGKDLLRSLKIQSSCNYFSAMQLFPSLHWRHQLFMERVEIRHHFPPSAWLLKHSLCCDHGPVSDALPEARQREGSSCSEMFLITQSK